MKKRAGQKSGPKAKPKTSNPDIIVKKSTYSKAARLAVLASAEARQRLIEMGGENTIDVIREFDKDMTDEDLAKKIGIKASDVRIVLNRLHGCGLFSYTRVRDKDSGWYSYIWKMSEEKLREFGGEKENIVECDVGEAQVEEDYSRKNALAEQESGNKQEFLELFERKKR
ncbi:MAG: hypothetical protein N3F07_00775 [Candidatus Micrarchaeota archaeon]|nr:hypothetical protein [Candidatus Micrarchaeota archaeon]